MAQTCCSIWLTEWLLKLRRGSPGGNGLFQQDFRQAERVAYWQRKASVQWIVYKPWPEPKSQFPKLEWSFGPFKVSRSRIARFPWIRCWTGRASKMSVSAALLIFPQQYWWIKAIFYWLTSDFRAGTVGKNRNSKVFGMTEWLFWPEPELLFLFCFVLNQAGNCWISTLVFLFLKQMVGFLKSVFLSSHWGKLPFRSWQRFGCDWLPFFAELSR